jgi:hypothetical protein
MSEFPVKRFGGKGHNDAVGVARSRRLRRAGGIEAHDNMSEVRTTTSPRRSKPQFHDFWMKFDVLRGTEYWIPLGVITV